MAQLRRKMRLAIQLYETTNNNRLKTGDPLTCEIYPAGAEIEVTQQFNPGIGATTIITCSGRGDLHAEALVRIIRYSSGTWAEVSTTDFKIDLVEEQGSGEGRFDYTLSNTSATSDPTTAPGDRIVAKRSDANQVTIYENESDPADKIDQPIDVPTNGVVEGYVDVRGIDVYLIGATIADNWEAFNIPTSSGEVGPLRLKDETVVAATTMNIDADTSILLLDAGAGPSVTFLEHCAPSRVLFVYPKGSGIQITTNNSKSDNSIYEAVGRTIDLDKDEPIMLVGNASGAPSVAYWTILATPALVDFGLDGLSDVATAGAAAGEPLVFNGTSWEPNAEVGTSAIPLTKVYASDDGLVLGAAGASAQITTSNLTANRIYSFPDDSTILIGTTGNANITGLKQFIVGTSGFKMSEIGYSRVAAFDVSGINAATTRVFAFPDKDGTFALVADIPVKLSDLDDITTSGLTGSSGDVIGWDGSEWVSGSTLGSPAKPLTAVTFAEGGFLMKDGGTAFTITMAIKGALTVNRLIEFGDFGGSILTDEYHHQTITKTFDFDDTGTPEGMFYGLENVLNGILIFRAPSISRGNGLQVTGVSYQWILEAPSTAAVPYGLDIYDSFSIPAGTTVPPPSGSSNLLGNIPVPGVGVQELSGFTTGDIATQVPAGNIIWLDLISGSDGPGVRGQLHLAIEYRQIAPV